MAKRYNILTRCLAALALFFVYVVSSSAILVGATTSPAQAWRGGGRGYYRGGGWGYRGRGYGYRGYGFGGPVVVAPGPRCWWNAYRGVRVCRW
ncbi:hypothetical protein JQ604_16615 [Bradyrhizobium jicamae]|uniref:hypothetical protein n=1 Tax=Bradyrhizobium jicamae TaxID=280332 RepID=UPI001BA940E1|nr:hypothetical protein [Bradyrhizobium jicamae]MBR0753810.1 hypothetical protein [Bradyrhizobium jicamae]